MQFSLRTSLLILLSASLFSGCAFSPGGTELVGKPAPEASYFLLDGTGFTTASDAGRAIAILFWDAECRHCRREIPKFNHLAQSFRDNEEVRFVAISVNNNNEVDSVKAEIAELDSEAIRFAFSGNGVYDGAFLSFKGDSVPYFVLIGREGRVEWVGNSADDLRDELIPLLR